MVKRKQKYAKPLAHVRRTHPMWRYGQSPKQSRFTALIGILLTVVMCAWMLLSFNKVPVWLNDQRRDLLARDVFNHPLPERTEVIERDYGMVPAGDGACAFEVRQTLRTYQSVSAVAIHYRDAEFRLRIPSLSDVTARVTPELTVSPSATTEEGTLLQMQVRFVVPGTGDPRCEE